MSDQENATNPPQYSRQGASDGLSDDRRVGGKQVDKLSEFKKDKNVLKFMKKYRYQYHVTMLPDLATLVRDAYFDGYHNGVGQPSDTNSQAFSYNCGAESTLGCVCGMCESEPMI